MVFTDAHHQALVPVVARFTDRIKFIESAMAVIQVQYQLGFEAGELDAVDVEGHR